jgi:hypothetical protein
VSRLVRRGDESLATTLRRQRSTLEIRDDAARRTADRHTGREMHVVPNGRKRDIQVPHARDFDALFGVELPQPLPLAVH